MCGVNCSPNPAKQTKSTRTEAGGRRFHPKHGLGTAAVSGGEATLTLKASKVPQKGITIVYSGDANDKASTVTMPRLT